MHWQYFCDVLSSHIFKMRISLHKSLQFFLISRFLSSQYAPQHVLYSSLICWLLFSFCYWSMPKLSEALHGLVFNFSEECYNADTLLCVSYWASFTAENYCYNKTLILITPVFPDSSLKMLLFCSFIVSKIYNSIKVCTFLNNNLFQVLLFVFYWVYFCLLGV